MILATAAFLAGVQGPDLAAVTASEARRVAAVARCAPAVCSVMAMDAPGGGSGVVVDPAGFVLTNYHVVGAPDDGYSLPAPPAPPADELAAFRSDNPGASAEDEVRWTVAWQAEWRAEHQPTGKVPYRTKKVGMPDGELYEAVVLGIDPGSDLAMLRLVPKREGQTWPSCRLGDSDRLLVGQTVFAMGNPFLLATDFTPTVTFGIVSGTHRYQEGQGQRFLVYPDCIQVDAPVNPGNSGGPLFDEAGDVVGINGRISIGERGRVNVGVGFAIASNQIRNFLGDLLAGRHAEHGTMDMSAWFMNSGSGTERRRGVFVQQMFRDSVAQAAGVGLGDEITRFDGVEVRSANQLATLVGVLPAGTYVTLWHRPKLDEERFGDERRTMLRLAVLDTGSSQDGAEPRLASRRDRRLAAAALLARHTVGEDGGEWTTIGPDGSTVRRRADGERLRLDLGDRVLVREGADAAFVVENGAERAPSAEERARLDREWSSNPLLWRADERARRLQGALLLGGVHVHGRPAFRFGLPGDGEREVWLFEDGAPAGYCFRDPLRRALVALHVRDRELRVVVDGVVEAGWSFGGRGRGPFAPELFRRQS